MALQGGLGDSPDFASSGRRRTFKILISLICITFILRLAQLQIIEGSEYRNVSHAQAIKKVRIEPFRGNMYDRNGIMIVHNEPSFSVNITPYEFKPFAMPLLSSLLQMDSSEIHRILDKYKNYSPFIPIKVFRDADFKTVSLVSEYYDYLPGVEINVDSKRLYEFDCNMAHLLGYTREITSDQLSKKPYYNPGDVIGQSGLEGYYETFLRGKEGIQFVAVNKSGKKVASFDNGTKDIPANNGFDLYLSIDIKLQEMAEKALAGKRGAVVAIDPSTGEIIICASKPDYDPRSFSGKVPAELYNKLSSDEASPLLHRAIMSQYPPGSTWKMLVAIAALNEGIIDEHTTINCPGGFQFGNKFHKCHGAHGAVNVRSAIKGSCNTFFYQLGLKIGMANLEKYGQMFNFGMKTGIDLPGEKIGRLPTMKWLERIYGKDIAVRGRLVNYGIGQGEILVTPLQMAAYTAALANNGTYYQPHIVKAIKNNYTNKTEPTSYSYRKIQINPHIFKVIQDGMFDVVNAAGGTASIVKVDGISVCGKTGTAENPHGNDHAWFICFAPRENPKIAMCVFVENAGFGGAVSAPIARDLLNAFFHPESIDLNTYQGTAPADSNKKVTNTEYIPD